ncbi:MAG: hypothetical protein AB9900_06605 [Humidesulfovibrio sp.]
MLRLRVAPALGCTEPVAVALAALHGMRNMGQLSTRTCWRPTAPPLAIMIDKKLAGYV